MVAVRRREEVSRTLCMLENVSSADFFFKNNFFKKVFHEEYQSVKRFGSNLVCPDLGPNCLQWLTAEEKRRR